MKRALFQIIWTAGVGELYASVADVINCASILKAADYNCELVFNIGRCHYVNNIAITDLFDREQFHLFNSIITTSDNIREFSFKGYEGMDHIFTGKEKTPNFIAHQWSLFSNDSNIINLPGIKEARPMQSILNGRDINPLYTVVPKFTPEIENISKQFMNNVPEAVGIQIRLEDSWKEENLNHYVQYENSIKKIIEDNNQVYITTNSTSLKEKFKNYTNIKYYDYKYSEVGKYFKFYPGDTDFSEEILHSNLKDIIVEMCNLKHVKKLYSYNQLPWYSLFLYPALINKQYNYFYNNDELILSNI